MGENGRGGQRAQRNASGKLPSYTNKSLGKKSRNSDILNPNNPIGHILKRVSIGDDVFRYFCVLVAAAVCRKGEVGHRWLPDMERKLMLETKSPLRVFRGL